jgi:hypothetical protein
MWFLSTSEMIEQTKTPSRLLHLLRVNLFGCARASHSHVWRVLNSDSSVASLQVLRERKCGYGILVSQVPKDTEAFYSLRDPSEVNLSRYFSVLLCTLSDSFNLALWLKSASACHTGDGVPQFLGEMEEALTVTKLKTRWLDPEVVKQL